MFMTHIQWRKEFGVDELDHFVFQERDAMISLYPQGYHKIDKLVSSHHTCIWLGTMRLPLYATMRRCILFSLPLLVSMPNAAVNTWMVRACLRALLSHTSHAGSAHIHTALGSD